MQLAGARRPSSGRPLTVAQALEVAAARAAECGFFFDFDGTLAPIQDDPESVQLVPGARAAIERLSGLVKRVAIVSARPASFLRERFGGLPRVALHGLYGLEVSRAPGEITTEPAAVPWIPVVAELYEKARAELPPATLVEFKRLAVALHYRTSPELRELVEAWGEREARERGLLVQGGRMVIELKPPVERDKRAVIREETRDLGCAWYFGDDLSDLGAFGALSEREAEDGAFVGVRVAVANPETGGPVTGAADLALDSPRAVPEFLAGVITAIEATQAG
jgi:trehalose 6-phosphate phosphatase